MQFFDKVDLLSPTTQNFALYRSPIGCLFPLILNNNWLILAKRYKNPYWTKELLISSYTKSVAGMKNVIVIFYSAFLIIIRYLWLQLPLKSGCRNTTSNAVIILKSVEFVLQARQIKSRSDCLELRRTVTLQNRLRHLVWEITSPFWEYWLQVMSSPMEHPSVADHLFVHWII